MPEIKGQSFSCQEKLINMKRTLPFLASLTFAELGVEEPDETTALMAAIVEEERQEKERAREREEYVSPPPHRFICSIR